MGNETDKYRCSTTQQQHNLSVEEVYDKEELSTKLVVKDHNADVYRVFHSREEFWEFNDGIAEHLRSFSEVVYGDLPQFPRIHVEFGSLNKLPGTKIVNLLRPILDGMLEVIRTRYSGKSAVPNSLKDFVIMDEYGQNRHGYWTNDFHIQATSFAFTDYKEAKEFTRRVRSSLPVEVGRFISLQYNDPIQLVPILGSTCPKESLHKKISRFSQFLGTSVDIHKNELFVKKFPDLDYIVPSTPVADSNTKNNCDQPNSPDTHENTNIKDPHSVVCCHENGFDIKQLTPSSVEQELQNKSLRDDEQPDNTYSSETPREGSMITLSTKKNPPPVNKQYAIAINCLVLFFFVMNKIKQGSREMQGGTHGTKERALRKGQRDRLQHNRSAKNGKGRGRRNSCYWKRWRIHDNLYIRPEDSPHKNEMINWETIVVSMIALDRGVIYMRSTSETRSYGCVPHKVIAITLLCQSYQFNPP
ncbi:uncharacterized protein OCT59_002886 [Rhizophagus irregularis]|uniref:Uncharacterized protein n=5 Tax=Rhizophagus irregularis TaxID=588596 RepID=A0A915ZPJ2_9GLOM|nr:hypothetical protein GLOIN_2v368374 [Rhizophagus irregularis DAOM 181602=DAOM 197198]UZO11315.1 hypothetical protein OCT59_002886 [Rhizophagus irregularis]POG66223.1 hypothetical protein GLOIN_2v368374 [Rhizophagus irregularis DAOM 181602=DAOM 197198]CAB4473587.1 unnamed protein product [Rhizophagus irregularis]CAB5185086.1 unnamed protein product [Rhizophagus irregularis]CAB5384641.1 unnamed protein product [Rhizophagus irregularis]|eukprot:XP_025173089.1 hypothetical protein GLOIN_2v368374 [Rhizophagus irregularis DAOM 181602=DAOM 197198]